MLYLSEDTKRTTRPRTETQYQQIEKVSMKFNTDTDHTPQPLIKECQHLFQMRSRENGMQKTTQQPIVSLYQHTPKGCDRMATLERTATARVLHTNSRKWWPSHSVCAHTLSRSASTRLTENHTRETHVITNETSTSNIKTLYVSMTAII